MTKRKWPDVAVRLHPADHISADAQVDDLVDRVMTRIAGVLVILGEGKGWPGWTRQAEHAAEKGRATNRQSAVGE